MKHTSRITRRAALGAMGWAALTTKAADLLPGEAAKPVIVLAQSHVGNDPGAVLLDPHDKNKVIATERMIVEQHVQEFSRQAEEAGYQVYPMYQDPALYEYEQVADAGGIMHTRFKSHGRDKASFDLALKAEKLKPDFVLYFHVNAASNAPHAKGTLIFATTHEANTASMKFVQEANRAFHVDQPMRLHNFPGIQLSTYVAPEGREPVVAMVELDFLNRQNLEGLTNRDAVAARCKTLLQSVENTARKDKSQATLKNR